MKLKTRFRKLTLWKKLGAVGAVCSILSMVLVLADWLFFRNAQTPVKVSVQELPHAKVMIQKPLKERIRDSLREINPEIIELVDAGHTEIGVMINIVNLPEMLELQKEPDFERYLMIRYTGSVIMGGSNNQMGNFLNDTLDGTLHGYVLTVKPPLSI